MRGPLDVQAWTWTDSEYQSCGSLGGRRRALRAEMPVARSGPCTPGQVSVGAASRTRNAPPPNRSGAPPPRRAPVGLGLGLRYRVEVRRQGEGLTSNKRMQLADASL
jgi:hypothetical protein